MKGLKPDLRKKIIKTEIENLKQNAEKDVKKIKKGIEKKKSEIKNIDNPVYESEDDENEIPAENPLSKKKSSKKE